MGGIRYSKLKVRHPCYDEATKTDCPKRKAGCRSNCSDWKKYEKAREEERKEMRERSRDNHAYLAYVTDRSKKIRRIHGREKYGGEK
jgi:hypothetical protein